MSKDLYVKNLPPEITEEELRKLFSVAGKVSYIHMGKDTKSGQFRGYGYVKMASEAEAKEAVVCLDGARINDRYISVSIAKPQQPGGARRNPAPNTQGPAKQRQKRRK
ncbi:RNA-binding protein [Syntrophotalea carbinolica DSM 2380]|uniref:RNA-binding protein n=1 Tax=Syntrophotalea carbinolica (strain DSM 2380 / NBRC 103641 / GraBd1) TaxID=338963 RepID=Q3A1M0_SYNC1|nr:RNA-binding protein [Syntrophotalea carbinolica]ABA89737.1 RNA-binding protein [Syntrophotalea carbinolica DSM 2380]